MNENSTTTVVFSFYVNDEPTTSFIRKFEFKSELPKVGDCVKLDELLDEKAVNKLKDAMNDSKDLKILAPIIQRNIRNDKGLYFEYLIKCF
jgi:hypothetical protein